MSRITGIGIGVPYRTYLGLGGITDTSTFYAPLTNSLILTKGAGNPTFTRVTAAWSFDNENKLISVPATCARFGGARLVRNLVQVKSEDFSNAAWVPVGLTVSGTNLLVCANSTTGQSITNEGATLPTSIIGNNYIFVKRVSYINIRYVQLFAHSFSFGTNCFANFDLVAGTVQATGCTATITSVSSGVWDLSVLATATLAASNVTMGFALVNSLSSTRKEAFVGDGIKSISLLRVQAENVSGQTDQTASEYVSVGVLSAPFHGAGVDGCKWFNTNKDGTSIDNSSLQGYLAEPASTNNCLWGRDMRKIQWAGSTYGSNLTVNSGFAADTDWTKRGTATIAAGAATAPTSSSVEQAIATVIGARYALVTTVSVASNRMVFNVGTAAGLQDVFTDPAYRTTTGAQTAYFTATTTTSYIRFGSDTGATGSAVFDDFTCTPCGIGVVPTTGIDNVANSASRLTCAATDATILQLLTAATGTRTTSVYLKRITGTGTISITRNNGSSWTDVTSQINSSGFARVQVTSDVGANPTIGIKMGTSGDVIDVDCFQDEPLAWASTPILTTTAAVTRNADVLSYANAFNVTQGTALCSVKSDIPINSGRAAGILRGDVSGVLLRVDSTDSRSLTRSNDGTNSATATGLDFTTGRRKRAVRWGSDLMVSADGILGTTAPFDGGMGASTTLSIGHDSTGSSQVGGSIKEVFVWPTALTNEQHAQVTS